MTDAELQAEIDREAARIRAWRDLNQVDTKGLLVIPDRLVRQLAEHLVANRAVELQNDTRLLVEAARQALKDFDAYDTAGLAVPLLPESYGLLLKALVPFGGQFLPPAEITTTDEQTGVTLSQASLEAIRAIQRGE